jgi:hypothetical protein
MVWLHGTLTASILEAKDLPDDDNIGLDLASKVGTGGGMFSSALRSVERVAGNT